MKISGYALLAAALLATPFAVLRPAEAEAPPTTHEVKMHMEGTTARFEPANLTIKRGDRVRFVTVTGGPHNVAFEADKVPDAAEAALTAGMPNQIAPLAGPLVMSAGDSYTVSFAGVPAGSYEYICMPHVAMGMKGKITVQP
ncbi:MAG TPA: plastocyanin/azurin family copper-binding protein [Longimicrobiaceae bacterium]|nr:plastocyanin/azurin family copper-binding protein [Longimicrobiaceae bacterium]